MNAMGPHPGLMVPILGKRAGVGRKKGFCLTCNWRSCWARAGLLCMRNGSSTVNVRTVKEILRHSGHCSWVPAQNWGLRARCELYDSRHTSDYQQAFRPGSLPGGNPEGQACPWREACHRLQPSSEATPSANWEWCCTHLRSHTWPDIACQSPSLPPPRPHPVPPAPSKSARLIRRSIAHKKLIQTEGLVFS